MRLRAHTPAAEKRVATQMVDDGTVQTQVERFQSPSQATEFEVSIATPLPESCERIIHVALLSFNLQRLLPLRVTAQPVLHIVAELLLQSNPGFIIPVNDSSPENFQAISVIAWLLWLVHHEFIGAATL